MGLFDRLFGKKKETPAQQEQVLEPVDLATEPEAETDPGQFVPLDLDPVDLETADRQDELNAEPEIETEFHQSEVSGGLEPSADLAEEMELGDEVHSQLLEAIQSTEVGADDSGSHADESGAVTPAQDLETADCQDELAAEPETEAQLNQAEIAGLDEPSADLVEEPEAPEPSESQFDQAQQDHFTALMADYYAKKAAVQAAAERGEELVLEAQTTRPVQEPEAIQTVSDQPEALDQAESREEKYHRTLKKTRTGFGARLNAFLANFRRVDEEFFEELEELLILSDVGVTVATKLTEELRYEAKLEKAKKPEDLRRVIIAKLVEIYEKDGFESERVNFQEGLTVMLFVGVNGVGKTTSIGKLAHQYKQAGKRVMLVAADTFRAGAVAQLVEWGRRVDVPVVTGPEKSDPASVVFDGMEKAVAEGVDILLIDTAGRLQNKDNLMAELEKIGRIIKRVVPEAPHETLLALDASTGQNALSQAKEFSKITPLTGLVLTKLDGTAKGGVVLAIREELDIPVKFIGFGEKIDDIGAFRSEDFMKGLLDGLV